MQPTMAMHPAEGIHSLRRVAKKGPFGLCDMASETEDMLNQIVAQFTSDDDNGRDEQLACEPAWCLFELSKVLDKSMHACTHMSYNYKESGKVAGDRCLDTFFTACCAMDFNPAEIRGFAITMLVSANIAELPVHAKSQGTRVVTLYAACARGCVCTPTHYY